MIKTQVKSDWVQAYSAANPMEAELIVGMLEHQGIAAGLRSQGLVGGIGELPMDALYTPVWVAGKDLAAARQLLETYESEPSEPAWQCSQCGENNEGNFELCWQCGAEASTRCPRKLR